MKCPHSETFKDFIIISNPKMCNPKMSKSIHMCTRIFNQNSIQCSLPKMIIRVNTSFWVNVKVIWNYTKQPQANFKCFFLFCPLEVKIICQVRVSFHSSLCSDDLHSYWCMLISCPFQNLSQYDWTKDIGYLDINKVRAHKNGRLALFLMCSW